MIKPKYHSAFMAYLGKTGQIDNAISQDDWLALVHKRYKCDAWQRMAKAAGIKKLAATRAGIVLSLQKCFEKAHPEWARA